MVKLETVCPWCNGRMISRVTQSIKPTDGRLMFYTYDKCKKCNYRAEFDDYGRPPEMVRQKMLARDGLYALVIDEVDKGTRLEITRVFRSLFEMSTVEALKFSQTFPGVLYNGTEVEVEWLRRIMEERGVETEIRREVFGQKAGRNKVKLKRFGFFAEMSEEVRLEGLVPGESRHELEREILDYLESGVEYLMIGGLTVDYLGGEGRVIGPPHVYTDGLWAWSKDVIYYIKRYYIEVPEPFVAHMKRMNWKLPMEIKFEELEL